MATGSSRASVHQPAVSDVEPGVQPETSGTTGRSAGGGRGKDGSGGGGLGLRQQERIESAIEACRTENGLDVSVLVGDLEISEPDQFRPAAEKLHAALGSDGSGREQHAVLVVVAPGQRRVEVVTGPGVRRRVPDRVCALAVLSMTSAFSGGDLAGGIVDGLRQIADAAGARSEASPVQQRTGEMARREDVHGGAHAPAAGAGHDEVQATPH